MIDRREKFIETILRGRVKPGSPNFNREDVEMLIDLAPKISDDELAKCIGAEATPIFRKIYQIIFA